MRSTRFLVWCSLVLIPPACHAQQSASPFPGDSTDPHASAMAMEEMTGPMAAHLHLLLTPTRPALLADSARVAALLNTIRTRPSRYRDVRAALAGGYRPFLPRVKQVVYHYTNRRNALAERFRFDPAAPTSLLYRKDSRGALVLVGVMYSEGPDATLEELDRRVPLSIVRWHEHVDWCLPPRGSPERWRDSLNGQPVFGPRSLIASPQACAAVQGRFVPRLFGWMVHVNAFAGDDPREIWGGEEMHEHS